MRYEVRISGPGSVATISTSHATLADAECRYNAVLARSPEPTEAGRGAIVQLIDHRRPKHLEYSRH